MSHHDWFQSTSFVIDIARGDGVEPYRSRILVPLVLLGASKLSSFTPVPIDVSTAHWGFYALCLTLAMVATRLMLRSLGYSRAAGIVGALSLGGLLPIALRDHGYQAWSWLELVLIPTAVWLAAKRVNVWIVAPFSVFAALNRESAILVPLIFAVVALSDRQRSKVPKSFIPAIGSLVAVVLTLACLKFVWPGPGQGREITIDTVHQKHLLPDNIPLTLLNVSLLVGSLLILGAVGLLAKRVPRAAVYVFAAIAPLTLTYWRYFALWWEVRILAPLVISLIPLAVSGLGFHPRGVGGADP